jgi:branched-chain amino acid transport system ATP-binding protein
MALDIPPGPEKPLCRARTAAALQAFAGGGIAPAQSNTTATLGWGGVRGGAAARADLVAPVDGALLAVDRVSLGFGGLAVLTDVSLAIRSRERVAVIGPNGAGKTSLINCINGFYHPVPGRITYHGHDITRAWPHEIACLGVGRTFQNIELFTGATVLDNLLLARHRHIRYGVVAASLYYGRAQAEEVAHRARVEEVIDFLELEPLRHAIVGGLPYGQRKRVELGRALATDPQLLLLDEPMAGMTFEEKQDMVRFIIDANEALGITILLIEHDMGVVMDVAHRIYVLDFGDLIGEGTPAEISANPRVLRAYLGEEAIS